MGALAGVLFAAQRQILGQPIGIVNLGHFCGDHFLVARDGDRCSVLAAAVSSLTSRRRVHTLRACIKQGDSLSAVFENVPGMILTRQPIENRDLLHLGTSFDAFLRTLGPNARRNFRRYPDRAKLNGWRYVESLSPNAIMVALRQLAARQRTSSYTYERTTRLADAVKKLPNPVFMGLQTVGGKWLSVLVGWYSGDRGHILLQLNRRDVEYNGAHLSLVMRSHALQSLIERGVREIRFPGGCQGILKPYCEPHQYEILMLKKTDWRPRLFLSEERCRGAARRWFCSTRGAIETVCSKRTIQLLSRVLLPPR